MLSLSCFTTLALSQSAEEKSDYLEYSIPDSQEVAKCFQDRILLRQLNEVNKGKIANLEKENELLKKELELKDRVIEIDQKEIASKDRALVAMAEVADRAIKLAETSKPGFMDKLVKEYGPIIIIAIIIVKVILSVF